MNNDQEKLLELFYNRKSIRKFTKRSVAEEDVKKIVEIGQRAPTGGNSQVYSIIWVKEPELRTDIMNMCGEIRSIREAPVVLLICADLRRLSRTIEHLGVNHYLKKGQGFWYSSLDFFK
ncbi:nitroreductase family protein [Thermoproteota archaeon]